MSLDDFGHIDIYLLDQLLRRRLRPEQRILDVACGRGRNVDYLLRVGADVCGFDRDAAAIAALRTRCEGAGLADGSDRFWVADAEDIDGGGAAEASYDFVICNALLHFAEDDEHFARMLLATWRRVALGGTLFVRTASRDGVSPPPLEIAGGRARLPDGSERFLVDYDDLMAWTTRLGAELADPIKTVIVHGQRSMATWVLNRVRSG